MPRFCLSFQDRIARRDKYSGSLEVTNLITRVERAEKEGGGAEIQAGRWMFVNIFPLDGARSWIFDTIGPFPAANKSGRKYEYKINFCARRKGRIVGWRYCR